MPPKKRARRDKSRQEWRKQHSRGGYFKGKKKKGTAESGGDRQTRGAGYTTIVKENALLVKYYKGQGFIPEQEWDQFLSIMKEDLPATFRITGTRRIAEHVRQILEKKFFKQLTEIDVEGERVPPPQPIPWYPNNFAWHVSLTRKFIRKSSLVSKFHAFLVKENEQGNISRQETVSMIPPLLLDVKPHHKVLDMCAAPGSKTAQLIEFLHAEDTDTNTIPSGVVVANDADNKRCYMLVHQAKRLNSPSFMVTNHDVSVFPMLYYHDEEDVRHPLYYDKVLCDVPCSGDGTLRKNPIIWKNWTPSNGPSLHKLQLRIIHRGLELLAIGGRLVYSTCSLNPVEDEAVIATALTLCKGTVELVDCSERLQGLKRISGLTTWKVMTREGEWLSSVTEIPKSNRRLLQASMFPPSPEEVSTLHLDRCMRVLPHHQDTGGFFIAVLEKKEWLPWQRKQRRTRDVKDEKVTSKSNTSGEDKMDVAEEEILKETSVKDTVVNKGTDENVTYTDSPVQATQQVGDEQDTVMAGERGSKEVAPSEAEGCGDELADDRTSVDATCSAADGGDDGGDGGEGGEGGDGGDGGEDNDGDAGGDVGGAVEKMEEEGDTRPTEAVFGKSGYRQRKGGGFKEDPYVFLDDNSDVMKSAGPYFGLSDNFPSNQLLVRTHTGKKRNVYFASRLVKELTKRNEHVLKIINIGVKIMARCDHVKTTCDFRLSQEGGDTMVPFISSHKIKVNQEDLRIVLSEANPLTTSLSQMAQQSIKQHCTGMGPVVFVYNPDDQSDTAQESTDDSIKLSCPVYLSGWVAAQSVRLYVDKNYRYHYLSMLGYEPPENQSLKTINARMRRGEDSDERDYSSDEEKGEEKGEEQATKEENGEEQAVMEGVPEHDSVEAPQDSEQEASGNTAPSEEL